jgi:hypothetical protein
MFERRRDPLIAQSVFLQRVVRHGGMAVGLVLGSLLIGILGYHELERLPWVDALLNAAMILGGMGPVNELHTVPGKLFASAYAIFSGIIFLVTVGVLFAPFIHRFLHHFHLEITSKDD